VARIDGPPPAGGVVAAGARASASPFAADYDVRPLQADATDQMDLIGVSDQGLRDAVQARVVSDGDPQEVNTAVLVRDEINRAYDRDRTAGRSTPRGLNARYDAYGFDADGNSQPVELRDERGHMVGATVWEHRNPETGQFTTHIDLAPAEFAAPQGPYGNGPTSYDEMYEVGGKITIVHPTGEQDFNYQVTVTDGAGVVPPQVSEEPHEELDYETFVRQQVDAGYIRLSESPVDIW